MEDISIDKVKELLEAYGIQDIIINDKHALSLLLSDIIFMWSLYGTDNNNEIQQLRNLDYGTLPLFIKFLRTCKGSDIELRGIIKNPKGLQQKNTELSFTITDQELLEMLDIFMNTLLARFQHELFEGEYGIGFKGFYKDEDNEEHSYLIEPYTDEELDKIISYYKHLGKKYHKLVPNAEKGKLAKRIDTLLNNHVGNKFKTQTKRYAFIYDLMLCAKINVGKKPITDMGSEHDRDKSIAVNNWINQYKEKSKELI